MKKRENNIKQHYIPQLYLKNFCDSEGFLHVFNYKMNRKYRVGSHKESYEKYFHDVNLTLFNHIIGMETSSQEVVDDAIRIKHENIVANSFASLLETLSPNELNEGLQINIDHMDNIIEFIILHIIRTPQYRENIDYLVNNFILYYNLDLEELEVKDAEVLPTIHNLIIYGLILRLEDKYSLLGTLYENFFGHILDDLSVIYMQLRNGVTRFMINKSTCSLITTPNPVNVVYNKTKYSFMKTLVVPMDKNEKVWDTGYINRIDRVYLPISSEIGIFFFDREFAREHNISDRKIQVIEENDIDIVHNLNISMASKSTNKVYSNCDNFNALYEMIENKSPSIIRIY